MHNFGVRVWLSAAQARAGETSHHGVLGLWGRVELGAAASTVSLWTTGPVPSLVHRGTRGSLVSATSRRHNLMHRDKVKLFRSKFIYTLYHLSKHINKMTACIVTIYFHYISIKLILD